MANSSLNSYITDGSLPGQEFDSSNVPHYALIEVKANSNKSNDFIKHLITHDLPEGLKDGQIVRIVVYTGETDMSGYVKYVNLEEFITNPWLYII